jgi:rhamnosyl/mannosyltransferase
VASNSKLRILHIARRYDTVGGVERYIRDLAQAHRSQGHQVDVLAVGQQRGLLVQAHVEGGSTAYMVPELFNYQSAVASLRFPDTFARLSRRYDVLHFHYPNPIGELSYLLAAPLVRTPAIVTFHGEVVPQKRFSALYELLARLFFGRMGRIVTTSSNMLETARVLRPFKDRTTVIPLGIILRGDGPNQYPSPFPDGVRPRILFVGRLNRYKGVAHLIEAIRYAPGHLVVVGDGPFKAALEAQSRTAGVAGRVTFMGYIPDLELSSVYRDADMFVLPSIDKGEGFGYVLLEAMAASLPLISTELGTGTSYVNEHGKTGLVVPPEDPHALVDAIQYLAANPDIMRRFGQTARKRLLELFTFERMANAVEAEYQALLEQKRGRRPT